MKKLLIVGINEKIHTTRRLIEEAAKMKMPFIFCKWSSLAFENEKIFSGGKNIRLDNIGSAFFDIPSFDIVYAASGKKTSFNLDNDLFILLKILKEKGIPAANQDFMLNYSFYNKFTQQYIFNREKIATIDTVHLTDNSFEKVNESLRRNNFRFPVVVKESRGGMGKSVWKIGKNKLKEFLEEKRSTSLIFQRYIKNREDFRVVVVGGRSLGVMRRKAGKGEWKNNFALGGKIEKYADRRMEKIAEQVCRKIGIRYAGLDFFKSGSRYIIIEINSFFCFEGFERIYPEINVAGKILESLKSLK